MRLDFELRTGLICFTNPVKRKRYTFFAVLAIMSTGLGGCFAWNYVKVGYDNFSAYFNTFYNASVSFNEGMKDVKLSKQSYELSIIAGDHPAPFKISQKAKDDFNETLVEASKVLQYHPHSAYTQDCLFMIGISYYYQDDYLRGERKFLEIESTFPDTKRLAEAEMYYGALQLDGQQNEVGRDRLFHAIEMARAENKPAIVAMSSDILSDYYLRNGDTLTAAAYLDTASAFSQNDRAAIYACRAGRLYAGIDAYNRAIKAFERARREARQVETRFYSEYYFARVQRLLHRYAKALNILRTIQSNDNFFDYFPLVKYQEATVLYDSGEVSTAVTSYENIDTAYSSNVAATRSAYRLANIYLYLVGDFQSALKYYQRVSSHPRVYSVSEKGQEMAQTLQNYMISSYKVVLNDSLYYHAVYAVEHHDTAVKYSQSKLDSLYERAADARDELAGVFMFKLQLPDSAVKCYRIIMRDFKNSRVYPSALYSLGEYYYSSGDTTEGKRYLEELVKEHSDSPYAVSACSVLGIPPPVYVDSSQVKYTEAMKLAGMGKYGAAVDTLKELVKNKKVALTPKALYTVGWMYENKLQRPDSAFKYYKQLSSEFPDSKYSKSILLAVNGFEAAQLDSAKARKARADSIAALRAKQEKADSSKVGKKTTEKIHAPASVGTAKSGLKSTEEKSAAAKPIGTAVTAKRDSAGKVAGPTQPAAEAEKKSDQSSDSSRAPIKTKQDTSRTGKPPSVQIIKRGK